MTLPFVPDDDHAEPRNPGQEDLDQSERTADGTNPPDLLRPHANPDGDPIPHEAQIMAVPDETPRRPSLWTSPSTAVGASWRSPIWNSDTDRNLR
jgi:hypothetical protein